VDSTAATRSMVCLRLKPRPATGREGQASGILWTQMARMSEKSSTRPPGCGRLRPRGGGKGKPSAMQ